LRLGASAIASTYKRLVSALSARLPHAVRCRHAAELEQAERVDLAVGALLAFCRRIEAALARRVHAELLR
jgi:hypothetical protein